MTNAVDGGAAGAGASMEEFKRQQDIWAEELKKADARAQKFKEEVDGLLETKRQLRSETVAL